MNRTVNYDLICAQLSALTEDIPYEIANLSNAAALLWQELPDINWAGFYRMEGGALVFEDLIEFAADNRTFGGRNGIARINILQESIKSFHSATL